MSDSCTFGTTGMYNSRGHLCIKEYAGSLTLEADLLNSRSPFLLSVLVARLPACPGENITPLSNKGVTNSSS